MRAHAGGVEAPDDLAIGGKAEAFIAEHLLHRDHLALHAGDLGDQVIRREPSCRREACTIRLTAEAIWLRTAFVASRCRHGDHVFQTRHAIARVVGVDRGHRAIVAQVFMACNMSITSSPRVSPR